jgi:hypothetical protein
MKLYGKFIIPPSFGKIYVRRIKQGKDIALLELIVAKLANDEP